MDINEYRLFSSWVALHLSPSLEECGMRVRVEDYPDHFELVFTLPMEFRLRTKVRGDNLSEDALAVAVKIREFARTHYPDGLLSIESCRAFLALQGVFEFLKEDTAALYFRIAGIVLHDEFGRANIRKIVPDGTGLTIHCRRAGRYRITFGDFKGSLTATLERMRKTMRKPIRSKIL